MLLFALLSLLVTHLSKHSAMPAVYSVPLHGRLAIGLVLTLASRVDSEIGVSSPAVDASIFRLGSGAVATASVDQYAKNFKTEYLGITFLPTPGKPSRPFQALGSGHTEKSQVRPILTLKKIKDLCKVLTLGIVAVLLHMMPQMGGDRNFNYRIPPSWSPENDQNYSFRVYMTDISL